MRAIQASEFKAECLAILDEVERTGEPVAILKSGRPVACLVPPPPGTSEYPQKALFGTVEILGDVVKPALSASEWEAQSEPCR
jgi:prevent-host-death family protein